MKEAEAPGVRRIHYWLWVPTPITMAGACPELQHHGREAKYRNKSTWYLLLVLMVQFKQVLLLLLLLLELLLLLLHHCLELLLHGILLGLELLLLLLLQCRLLLLELLLLLLLLLQRHLLELQLSWRQTGNQAQLYKASRAHCPGLCRKGGW